MFIAAEEGEDIVSAIIDGANGQYTIDPITPDQAGIFARSITDNGCIRILPNDYCDIGGVMVFSLRGYCLYIRAKRFTSNNDQ